MTDTNPDWAWDETLFAGAARHYVRGRLPYAPGLEQTLAEVLGLDGKGTEGARLLDVGCGPGTLALRLAHLFGEVVGVDPDAEMLEEAARRAAQAQAPDAAEAHDGSPVPAAKMRWVRARAEDLPLGLGMFDAATFGTSFHWMERDRVAATVRGMLRPDGAFVHVADLKTEDRTPVALPYPAAPAARIRELVRSFLGPRQRAGRGVLTNDWPSGEAAVLARAGFGERERYVVPGGRPLERTEDDLVASVLSLSFSAPHLFGARLAEFEQALRALLREASPARVFSAVQPGTEIWVWRAAEPAS